jgi:outer membrane protein OmpA-like peptidoglycan-associated protein
MAARNSSDPQALPVAVSPLLMPEVFSQKDDENQQRLAQEFAQANALAARRIRDALAKMAKDPDLNVDTQANQVPAQLTVMLRQPEGDPVTRATVVLTGAVIDGQKLPVPNRRVLRPLKDGSVLLKLPTEWRRRLPKSIEVAVSGSNGVVVVEVPLAGLTSGSDVAPVVLPRRLDPVPLTLLADLADVGNAAPDGSGPAERPAPVKPEVALGEGDCELVFRTDPSQDRFAYSVLFRLTDPGMSASTLVRGKRGHEAHTDLRAVYPDDISSPQPEGMLFHLADRVAIDRPVSTDAFSRAVSGIDTPRRLPMAATLAIGYVVNLAQRWTQRGLALGDLVYSLPLAPGEQQRIAVVERTATSSVMEREALEQREDLRFDEVDTSSAHATFSAAFQESAQGGSSYDASSSSFSVAAAAGGGGVFPFGAFAGGVATSYGSSSASGSTSTWMSGARQSTSNAAQSTRAAVSRRANASRQSSRASVRLATATETTQVTTKVITNHNRTRALTMQYWEVLRLFDVSTVVEDVSLVCMVPLDIVDFLPPGEPARLDASALDRTRLLNRYSKLLSHSDVLSRVVPWRLRRGLQALNDFAADPRAGVQAPTGTAMNVLTVTVVGGFTRQDEMSAHFLLRSGMRTSAFPLSGSAPALPSGVDALSSDVDLFARLRAERQQRLTFTTSIPLPGAVGLQDVVALVLTRSVRRLDYTFAPAGIGLARGLLGGHPNELAAALAGLATQQPVSRSFGADQVARELGDMRVWSATAAVGGQTVVDQHFGAGAVVSESGLTISANRLAPELSYDSLLEIERSLQWVLRHTMQCSTHVVAALTAEERAVLLERYSITPPSLDANGRVQEGVPLLSCITNNVLGFYGNAMVMPFQIPMELAEAAKVDSAKLQQSLRRFHTEAFDHPTSVVALPTRGVLGEAVLGRCPSAEKIDLTRFWNWKDSPGDEATAISSIDLPSGNLVSGLEAPSKLTSLAPIINNFSTQGPAAADTSLATAIAGKAIELSKPFDIAALTNAGNLKDVVVKTTDTAESARKDALSTAKELAIKAMETHAALKGVKPPGTDKPPAPQPPREPTTPVDPPATPPEPVTPPAAPAAKPAPLKNFFNLDKTDLVDVTAEGRAGQSARITAYVAAAKAYKATAIVVRGYASPEGTVARNHELVKLRAEALATQLRTGLPGVTVTTAVGGIVSGPPSSEFPELRRADADITAP